MRNKRTLFVCQGAIIAALYAAITLVTHIFGLDSGFIQLRVSEMLCILPMFTPAAIPGLYLGCLLANLLSGAVWLDIIVGPIATLAGAYGCYLLRKHRLLAPIPTVLANTLFIPIVLSYGYGMEQAILIIMFTVGIGELIGAYIFGVILAYAVEKRKKQLFFL